MAMATKSPVEIAETGQSRVDWGQQRLRKEITLRLDKGWGGKVIPRFRLREAPAASWLKSRKPRSGVRVEAFSNGGERG